jgi:hypothetical protein
MSEQSGISVYLKRWIFAAILLLAAIGAMAGVILFADQPQREPDLNVKVKSFWPEEYLSINEPANIMIKFNRDLMPSDSLDKLTADCPIEIVPPLSGLGKWIAPDKFAYYPDSQFRPSTEYKVKVRSDRSYLYGNRINEPRTFLIRTPTITVTRAWHEMANVPPGDSRLLVHLQFNYPVDPAQLMEYLATNFEKIKFEVNEKTPSDNLTLISEQFSARDIYGDFYVKINKGLNCVGGIVPLQGDYVYPFEIIKPMPLVVQSVQPHNAGEDCRIDIYLSQSTSLEEVKDKITIDPPVKFTINQRYSLIQIFGNFKPRETYTINIAKGIRSLKGQPLERDFSTKVLIGDIIPNVKFKDEGLYLSRNGNRLIAIQSVNYDEITIEVEQVFTNNIVYYLGSNYPEIGSVGRKIFAKDFKLPNKLNEPIVSTFDIGKIVGDSLEGIYNVLVYPKEKRWYNIDKRILITDLGIAARMSDNYLMVWVNSLENTSALGGVDINLISRNNQTIVTGKTDARGVVVFDNIAEKMAGFEPFVITATKGNDLSFLQFNNSIINTSDFDVSGRPYLTKGYEPFIYSDRGVYRPGDMAHLVVAMRGVNASMPPEFPYVAELTDPQGHDFGLYKLNTKDRGLSSLDFEIPAFAKTGKYQFAVKIGEQVIGQYGFQVEDFMPDRIKTTLTTDKDVYYGGDQIQISVNGVYLFGPACAGNAVSGHITIESDVFRPKKWDDYSFDSNLRSFTPMQIDLPSDKLDNMGNHIYTYQLSQNLRPPASLKMLISGTVYEDGGRAVSGYKAVAAHPYNIYLGLQRITHGHSKINEPVAVNAVAVNGAGNIVALDTGWVKFYQIVYQNIVKRDSYGIYRYMSEESEQPVDSAFVSIRDTTAMVTFTPRNYGAYRVRFTSPRTDHATATDFYVSGWGYAAWSMAKPDRIELELDKKLYTAGQSARVLVKAPFSGKLLVTVEKEKVLDIKTYTLDSNTAQIDIPVKKEYAPNAYITCTLIKSANSLERFSPARAFGMVSLPVDNTDMKITMDIDAPNVMKPQEKVDIKIKTNLTKGTKLTVAAVDQGILQLTGFKTPDPFDFFFGKRRPALVPYDIYSMVFPNVKPGESNLAPGGSAAFDAARKRHLNPLNARRVKPVALWSGIVSVDAEGIAHVVFDVPQFNGKLTVMAVAFNESKCGSATDEITVRDKIVIQESLPRFIAPGDKINTPVVVFNNLGQADSISVTMKIDGAARLISKPTVRLYIPDNGKGIANFSFEASNKPGKAHFEMTATNGVEKSKEKVEMANRPGQPLLTLHGSGTVTAESSATITLPSHWVEGTAEYDLKLSSLPALKVAGGIQYLLTYPYGCLEQTTSHVFPLLYFNDLARVVQPEIFGGKGQEYFVAEGIQKISGMQLSSGAFEYWPGTGWVCRWSTIYATHFIIEARKAGYQVNDKVYDKAIDYLQEIVKEPTNEAEHGVSRIYTAYVLAKAGKLDKSIINELKKLNMVVIPVYSRFQLAAAAALTTGLDDAIALMPTEVQPQKYAPENGGNFDSDIRANAIILDVLTEIQPNHPSIPILLKQVTDDICVNRWYTTQSNAFALMAMGKFLRTQGTPEYTGTIEINGKMFRSFDTKDFHVNSGELGGSPITIKIRGKGNCYYYWQASGVSTEKAVNEFDNKLEVRRRYLDINGQPADLSRIHLGQQLVAEVSIVATYQDLSYVIINDMLPAGFEIENPRLATSGRLPWLPANDWKVSYMDIRDDRVLLFSDLWARQKQTYHYLIRVISAGEFSIPPVAAECMYDPTIASAASSGQVIIGDNK